MDLKSVGESSAVTGEAVAVVLAAADCRTEGRDLLSRAVGVYVHVSCAPFLRHNRQGCLASHLFLDALHASHALTERCRSCGFTLGRGMVHSITAAGRLCRVVGRRWRRRRNSGDPRGRTASKWWSGVALVRQKRKRSAKESAGRQWDWTEPYVFFFLASLWARWGEEREVRGALAEVNFKISPCGCVTRRSTDLQYRVHHRAVLGPPIEREKRTKLGGLSTSVRQ